MLQLNHNTSSNVIAVLPNITGSYSGNVDLQFKYDYTNQSGSLVPATVITNNNYLIMDLTGSSVPTASGFYTVSIYSSSVLIDNERAFISGSNNVSIDQYLYQTSSTFYVYNK
jgi:hypothetical protein